MESKALTPTKLLMVGSILQTHQFSVGSLSTIIYQGFSTSPCGCLPGFWNHQQYLGVNPPSRVASDH